MRGRRFTTALGAVALLAVQLTSSPRAAYGITGAVIGAAYVLRAIGDVGTSWLSWVSPIGWYQGMHAFSGLRWWPLLPLVVAAAVLALGATATFRRRDHGTGILAARPGPSRAAPGREGGGVRAGSAEEPWASEIGGPAEKPTPQGVRRRLPAVPALTHLISAP
jgi:hypothetical protein